MDTDRLVRASDLERVWLRPGEEQSLRGKYDFDRHLCEEKNKIRIHEDRYVKILDCTDYAIRVQFPEMYHSITFRADKLMLYTFDAFHADKQLEEYVKSNWGLQQLSDIDKWFNKNQAVKVFVRIVVDRYVQKEALCNKTRSQH